MKKSFVFFAFLFLSLHVFCQHNLIDSLRSVIKTEKTDTGLAVDLYTLSTEYQGIKSDSALLLAARAYSLSTKHHFLKGESWSLNEMALACNRLGDYTNALKYYIRELKIAEQGIYPDDIAIINMDIALVYNSQKDEEKALAYSLKADSIIQKHNLAELLPYSLLNIGDISEKAGKLSIAFNFTKQCYELALKKKDSVIIGTALNNLGNIYSKMGNEQQAIANYKSSIPYLLAMNDNHTMSECLLGLANEFDKKNALDSAKNFAQQAYKISSQNRFLDHALDASLFLSNLYKKQNKTDSALAYFEVMMALKDSIESKEKVRQLESLTIEEQLRQQQLSEQIEADKQDRREKLQLLAIGILIPVFFLVSIYISRKKVHSKIIEFSGIVSILLLFEYITLLIHPFVSEETDHSPFLEIIIFVGIAALITPTHHKIQALLLKRLAYLHEKHAHKIAVESTIDMQNKVEENKPEIN